MVRGMDTDQTVPRAEHAAHPTMTELKDGNDPAVIEHIATCAMCSSIVKEVSVVLPKGLLT
jgi:hypothetical protein